ncbi:hypothetical protein [Streptomyces sp. NPDC004291]
MKPSTTPDQASPAQPAMPSPTPLPPARKSPVAISSAEAFRRACRYEWRHLTGLRSTWILLGVVAALSLLTGLSLLDQDTSRPISSAAMADIVMWTPLATQVPALCFFLLVLGTGPVSTDLVGGAARTTWLAVNGRGMAYGAKCTVGFLVGATVAATSALVGILSCATTLTVQDAGQPDWAGVLIPVLRFTLWTGCWSLFCLALVSLIRSRIVPVLILCMWPLIAERLAGGALGYLPGLEGIGSWLPFAAGRAMLTDPSALPVDDQAFARTLVGSDLSPATATAVFCLYTALLTAAGWWKYRKQDAAT